MGKGFLSLKDDPKKVSLLIGCVGGLIAAFMAFDAFKEMKLQNGNEIVKFEAGSGSYEQKVIAEVEGVGKIPMTITVEEEKLTNDEAEILLTESAVQLDQILLNENESFQEIKKNLCFTDDIPGTPVEVIWQTKPLEYFYSDGKIREDVEIVEPVELKLSAVLSCQEYTKNYEKIITISPRKQTLQSVLQNLINEYQKQDQNHMFLQLPTEYDGRQIVWKKPLDMTFLYFAALTVGAVLFLNFGSKRDVQMEKRMRLEELEKEYAQVVSKFSMLLTAGLSVRTAWERIVSMDRKGRNANRAITVEMSWAIREMQKGISELSVYEEFAARVGLIHYKKLMTMFISHKRRGGTDLLESMNQEMLLAWEEKKRKLRQQGEKIGTKLLIPMMGMLAVVFVIILVPAFLSLQL